MIDKATAALDRLISGTRSILYKSAVADYARDVDMPFATLTQTFKGYCGLAQCVAGYALQDHGVDVRPVATQSLKNFWNGHALLTARMDGSRLFLLDPTFTQFCGVAFIDGAPSPESRLCQTPTGAALVDDLLERGYTAMTPEKAGLYLKALCNGQSPFSNDEESLAFLADPPPHPYHYHHEPDDDLFDREVLRRAGLYIKDFTF